MENRRKITTNTPSEKRVGYSRAIAIGEQRLYISGTTSINEQGQRQGDSLYEQTVHIFNKIESVIKEAGFVKEDVVLLRAYLTDMGKIAEFDQAFIEHFSNINPCCTLVGITGLMDPNLLVEIECFVDKG